MDGLGSPEHMIDHSMMDLKSNPYTWNSSPKIPYDVFQSNRAGELHNTKQDSFEMLIQISQELILAAWRPSLCGSTGTPPTEGRQSTTDQCPVRTLPSRSESRNSPNLIITSWNSNNLKARLIVFWSKLQKVSSCMWCSQYCTDLVLHVKLCWLRLKTVADNTLWWKCILRSNKSICNPLLATPLKDYRLMF